LTIGLLRLFLKKNAKFAKNQMTWNWSNDLGSGWVVVLLLRTLSRKNGPSTVVVIGWRHWNRIRNLKWNYDLTEL
jgi:hypothetical protein